MKTNFLPICSSHLPEAKRTAQLRPKGGGARPPGRWRHLHTAGSLSEAGSGGFLALASGAPVMRGLGGWLCLGEGNTQEHERARACTHTRLQRTPDHYIHTLLPPWTSHIQSPPHTDSQFFTTLQKSYHTPSHLEAPAQTTKAQVHTTTHSGSGSHIHTYSYIEKHTAT